jgi:hypothetical protein
MSTVNHLENFISMHQMFYYQGNMSKLDEREVLLAIAACGLPLQSINVQVMDLTTQQGSRMPQDLLHNSLHTLIGVQKLKNMLFF